MSYCVVCSCSCSPPVFSGARVTQCIDFCVVFLSIILCLLSFSLAILLSVLPFTVSYYPFLIFTNLLSFV